MIKEDKQKGKKKLKTISLFLVCLLVDLFIFVTIVFILFEYSA